MKARPSHFSGQPNVIIFDSTFPDDWTFHSGGPAGFDPHPGTWHNFWANSSIYHWRATGSPGDTPAAVHFAAVASAAYNHTPLAVNTGGGNYNIIPPASTPYLFQIDREGYPPSGGGSYMATSTFMKSVTDACKAAVPGIRLTTFVPYPWGDSVNGVWFGMDSDNWLKVPTYVPNAVQIGKAQDYIAVHQPWLNDLYAVTVTMYFNVQAQDQAYMYYRLVNYIHFLNQVLPNKRIIVETGGFREIAGTPIADDAALETWANLIRSCGRDMGLYGCIVWGGISYNTRFFHYLGIEA